MLFDDVSLSGQLKESILEVKDAVKSITPLHDFGAAHSVENGVTGYGNQGQFRAQLASQDHALV